LDYLSSGYAACDDGPERGVLEALSSVSAISKDGKLTDYVWAPSLKVDRFTFSSGTEF
jgi:hypothetical protein